MAQAQGGAAGALGQLGGVVGPQLVGAAAASDRVTLEQPVKLGGRDAQLAGELLLAAGAGEPRGGETAAILSTLTSTCRRHEINPQAYLTQLLANLPATPLSRVDDWLPDRWQATAAPPSPA